MRIVKEGEVPYELYGTCEHCGCEVECDTDDEGVHSESYYCPFTGTEVSYKVDCPMPKCHSIIYLKERKR